MKLKILTAILLAVIFLMAGCDAVPVQNVTQPQQAAHESDPVLTVDGAVVTAAQANVYIYLMQRPYEETYGSGIWQENRSDGVNWEDWLLEEVKKQITEMEILSARARQAGMGLTEEEKTRADAGADAAFEAMGDRAADYGITADTVREIYEKSQLAGNYYASVTEGYGLSLSEDELAGCTGMTVQQIFIAREDESNLEGNQTQVELADSLQKRAVAGEDFETLARAYSSSNAQWKLSFNKEGYVFDTDGWLEEAFTDAAWKLETGEISPVIESSYGYHVLKCTDKDSEELKQQEANGLLEAKKRQAFAADYEGWLSAAVCTEEDGWKKLGILQED